MNIKISASKATMNGKDYNHNDPKAREWLVMYMKRELFGPKKEG